MEKTECDKCGRMYIEGPGYGADVNLCPRCQKIAEDEFMEEERLFDLKVVCTLCGKKVGPYRGTHLIEVHKVDDDVGRYFVEA